MQNRNKALKKRVEQLKQALREIKDVSSRRDLNLYFVIGYIHKEASKALEEITNEILV